MIDIMLNEAKLSLKKSRTSAFDKDILRLIETAKSDMKAAGITKSDDDRDPLINQAIILYCHANFGEADTPERYERMFTALRDRLSLMTAYTDKKVEEK